MADQKRLQGELSKSRGKLKALGKGKEAAEGEKERLLASQQALQEELGQSRGKQKELEKGVQAAADEKAKLLADQQLLQEALGKSRGEFKELEKGKEAAEGEKERLLASQQALQEELGQSRDELKELAKDVQAAANEKEKLLADQQNLQKKIGDIEAKEQLRKNIIASLKDNFDRHGIDAEINEKTGEVTLPFNEAYFDFDSAELKEEMREYLLRIIPVYTKSIFSESDVNKYIKSIEIVGHASPIYLGKYVNPESLSKESREALFYNMDLSYRRARSIFKYILNKRNIKYENQKDLMLYLKVTGRSYLQSSPLKELPQNSMDMEEFCSKYDCEKLQSAIIRFNLVD